MNLTFDLNDFINKLGRPISSKEALKDVIPIEWSEEVLNGTKKITVDRGEISI